MKKLFTPFRVGVGLTAAWLLVGVLEVWRRGGIEVLQKMELNAVGDFFAGFFAPIAFLWLVLGYRQQGDELMASLESQRDLAQIAREQLNAELAQIAGARQERAKAISPLLAVRTTSPSADTIDSSLDLIIKNNGGDAHSVTCFVTWKTGEQEVVHIAKDLLKRGESTSGLLVPPAEALEDPFELQIDYRDQDNNSHGELLRMKRIKSGQFFPYRIGHVRD